MQVTLKSIFVGFGTPSTVSGMRNREKLLLSMMISGLRHVPSLDHSLYMPSLFVLMLELASACEGHSSLVVVLASSDHYL